MCAVLVLAVAAPVRAQNRTIEVGGGYSVLTPRDFSATENGWFASLSADVAWPIAIGAEMNTYASRDSYLGVLAYSSRLTTIAGGPQFHGRRDRRVVGFAQTFVGVAISSSTVSDTQTSITDRGSIFITQLGGGADIMVTRTLAVRAGLSAVVPEPYHAENWQYPLWRITVGGLYRFGAR